jgi:cytoskeletal protein CcmA (bactofilin family)
MFASEGALILQTRNATAPPLGRRCNVNPRGLNMKYEGADVNRLISNGLMGAGSMLDKNKPTDTPVATSSARSISLAREPSLIRDTAASSASRADSGPSVISRSVQMTGSIETPEELHIYGTIKGNVRASSLIIFKGGTVNGEVVAETVTVHGSVDGSIQAKKVHLVATATVRGDIFHDLIGIDPGAQFEGSSKRMPAQAIEAPSAANED